MELDLNEFDDFNLIEHKKDIILSLHQYDNSFEEGIQASIDTLKKRNDVIEANIGFYSRKLNGEDVFSRLETGKSNEYSIDKLTEYSQEREWVNDQLIALNEMKIIYLFKNLEISMKSLIKVAYPKVNVSNFFKWDSMKTFFDEKEIKLYTLEGYQEVIQVKKVNNNIKHTDELTNEISKIPEFETGMESEDLELFFLRVKSKVAIFQNELSQAVIKELFEFDDNKLNSLTQEIKERMSKEDVTKFIEKLKFKYEI